VRDSFLRSCKGFLFDLDGVLVDSYDCWFHMLQDAMKEQGQTPVTLEEFDARWGQGPEADREAFFPEWTLQEVIAFYEKRFPDYTRWARSEPGSESFLKQLRGANKQIAVASNSPTAIVQDLLNNAGLLHYADALIGADQVRESKPAPDLILKALESLGIKKKEACYIGDSVYDARAAEAAEIFFVGYKREGDLSVTGFQDLIMLAF
jgi:HAD superfamily hydrolase (TIGR01509 family)